MQAPEWRFSGRIIVIRNHLVYNKKCDELVKELSKHFSGYELSVMFDWFEPYSATESQLEAFEKILKDKLEEVIKLNKNL